MKPAFRPCDKTAILQAFSKSMSESEIDILHYCLSNSEKLYTGSVGDRVACAWGLVPPTLMSGQAYIWLYHNNLVEEHKFTFIRQSQLAVKEMLEEYPLLQGHAHSENSNGIRWLKWLGAEILEGGLKNLIPFEIRKKDG